jgi:hypothetical protein
MQRSAHADGGCNRGRGSINVIERRETVHDGIHRLLPRTYSARGAPAPVTNASKPELPFDRVPPPVAFCSFRELNPDIP